MNVAKTTQRARRQSSPLPRLWGRRVPRPLCPQVPCPQFWAGAGGTESLAEDMEAVWDLTTGGEGAFHQV